ncbi:MAG: NADH-quinone oxidoreductase subunit G [Betaproteobacteria bacterium]|jgi:NADH-quinone oxidoreductase subunit G|nr:NADH-quinone oxidoreductase subunit G [Betaproteobacteria bacterium]NBP43870.1 NADH-quinone oxidoreductase subunit G [Betaproteobacteria bacterium]
MVEIEIDGRKVEVSEGSMVMHAAEKIGTFIPHFCYHKKLSIAANCRMCLVEVEKAPKALPACATPVTQGMVVRTQSERATKAQKSVMEFLLINHPLDCPICDQGGECQLQDLAVGYGGSASRYEEEKRVVFHKDVGPLVSMEEMSRCIHCTRCVRFGQEIAGVMELGMSHRGEHSEIESFVGQTVDSELSGNMIDLCPVGALTSKPFRYQARTWELGRRKSVSPHDATGANLIVQVKNHQVMRVVPYENEAVNECWIADRDRFSYEALNGEDRLTRPMIKQGGQWIETDWSAALDYVVRGLQDVHHQHGPASIGALASPHSTVEELHLMQQLIRALGSDNIDSRLRAAEPVNPQEGVRWLGMPLAELSNLQRVLIVGGNVRKDQPLMAQRIRQAARRGAQVHAIHAQVQDWAMPIRQQLVTPAADWVQALASVASAVAEIKGVPAPVQASVSETARAIAQSLCSGERKAILLGNAAAHHVRASSLLALAQWIAESTGASFGHLGEAANTVGAQVVGAVPRSKGKTAAHMLQPGALKAVFLLQVEPGLDTASTGAGLADVGMVVSLSPFKANADVADVMLPISPFTETAGTFINTEGRAQSFHGVVRPLGDTRPAWKVLRVLGNLLGLQGFDQDTVEQVREQALPQGWESKLSNATRMPIDALPVNAEPVTASLYQLDGLVRRAPALQRTADAKGGH